MKTRIIGFIICMYLNFLNGQTIKIIDRQSNNIKDTINLTVNCNGESYDSYLITSGKTKISSDCNNLCIHLAASGYQTIDTCIKGFKNAITIQLTRLQYDLQPATISITENSNSNIAISADRLISIPAALGEPDIAKVIQFQAGVNAGEELSNELFIRGGSADQNLFLLNNIPIYRPNHLLGFQGTIDAKSLETVEFHKSDFPIEHNGRLSAVISSTLKTGNDTCWKNNITVGMVNSSLHIDGPIAHNKLTVHAGLRCSPLGFIGLNSSNGSNGFAISSSNNNSYEIADGSLMIKYTPNESNTLSTFSYNSHDKLKLISTSLQLNDNNEEERHDITSKIGWQNNLVGLLWTNTKHDNIHFMTTLGWSRYNYSNYDASSTNLIENDLITTADTFLIKNSINHLVALNKATIQMGTATQLIVGGAVTSNSIQPFSASLSSVSLNQRFNKTQAFNTKSNEINGFMEVEQRLSPQIQFQLGYHHNIYLTQNTITHNPAPQVALSFKQSGTFIKFMLAKTYQNLHNLVINDFGAKNETLIGADPILVPQNANQISAFFQKKILTNFLMRIDTYYKTFSNQTVSYFDIDEPTEFQRINRLDTLLLAGGVGKAYGVELFASTDWKNWFFETNYTWSKSNRRFDNLNKGNIFPYTYDRRHNLYANLSFRINAKWSIASNFVFYSGRRITLPEGEIVTMFGRGTNWVFGERNNGKLPNYNRLDISFSYEGPKGGCLNFGAYNAYFAKNVSFLRRTSQAFFNDNGDFLMLTRGITGVATIPILPFINWSREF